MALANSFSVMMSECVRMFDELREKDGDTYTPEVSFEPDACSGIFTICISSSKDPQRVEKRVFDVIDKMKSAYPGVTIVSSDQYAGATRETRPSRSQMRWKKT